MIKEKGSRLWRPMGMNGKGRIEPGLKTPCAYARPDNVIKCSRVSVLKTIPPRFLEHHAMNLDQTFPPPCTIEETSCLF